MRNRKSSVIAHLASRILRRASSAALSSDRCAIRRRSISWGYLEWGNRLGRLSRMPVQALRKLLCSLATHRHRSASRAEERLPWSAIDEFLKSFPIRPHRDVLLSSGAGCADVLAVGAAYPFRRIIGLAGSPDARAAAAKKIEAMASRQQCREILLCTGDEVQNDLQEVTLVLLVEHSAGSDSASLAESLQRSLRERPRKLTLVEARPADQPGPFHDQRWIRHVRDLPSGVQHQIRVSVYRSILPIYSEHVPRAGVDGVHGHSIPPEGAASTGGDKGGRSRLHPLCFEGDFRLD